MLLRTIYIRNTDKWQYQLDDYSAAAVVLVVLLLCGDALCSHFIFNWEKKNRNINNTKTTNFHSMYSNFKFFALSLSLAYSIVPLSCSFYFTFYLFFSLLLSLSRLLALCPPKLYIFRTVCSSFTLHLCERRTKKTKIYIMERLKAIFIYILHT